MKALAEKQSKSNSARRENPARPASRPPPVIAAPVGFQALQHKPCACGGGCPRCQSELPIQTKLAVSQPGDRYEQEADRVADEVMRMAAPAVPRPSAGAPPLHRRSGSDETLQRLAADRDPSLDDAVVVDEEEAEGTVQTLRSPCRSSGSAMLSKELLHRSQGGEPLAPGVRRSMETRFGADFSRVRIYPDSHAAALSQAVSARAFTYGADIYFGAGEYRPETQDGARVLAHELTHVIQQGASRSSLPVQQRPADPGANAPGAIQRLSGRRSLLRSGVRPWGANGPGGADYEIATDAGSTVTGWEAYMVYRDQYRYWCHGHSLDSYSHDDFSVYSGPPMATVIHDEWNNIAPSRTRAGDIAVWTGNFDHSAKFVAPVIQNGQLVPDRSELSTKNGQRPLARMSLTALAGIYGASGIAVYRHR